MLLPQVLPKPAGMMANALTVDAQKRAGLQYTQLLLGTFTVKGQSAQYC